MAGFMVLRLGRMTNRLLCLLSETAAHLLIGIFRLTVALGALAIVLSTFVFVGSIMIFVMICVAGACLVAIAAILLT